MGRFILIIVLSLVSTLVFTFRVLGQESGPKRTPPHPDYFFEKLEKILGIAFERGQVSYFFYIDDEGTITHIEYNDLDSEMRFIMPLETFIERRLSTEEDRASFRRLLGQYRDAVRYQNLVEAYNQGGQLLRNLQGRLKNMRKMIIRIIGIENTENLQELFDSAKVGNKAFEKYLSKLLNPRTDEPLAEEDKQRLRDYFRILELGNQIEASRQKLLPRIDWLRARILGLPPPPPSRNQPAIPRRRPPNLPGGGGGGIPRLR